MSTTGRRRANAVLLLALSAGATILDAARKAGVSERTVYRRLKEVEFQKQLADIASVRQRCFLAFSLADQMAMLPDAPDRGEGRNEFARPTNSRGRRRRRAG